MKKYIVFATALLLCIFSSHSVCAEWFRSYGEASVGYAFHHIKTDEGKTASADTGSIIKLGGGFSLIEIIDFNVTLGVWGNPVGSSEEEAEKERDFQGFGSGMSARLKIPVSFEEGYKGPYLKRGFDCISGYFRGIKEQGSYHECSDFIGVGYEWLDVNEETLKPAYFYIEIQRAYNNILNTYSISLGMKIPVDLESIRASGRK